jgi:hypothetical protein
MALRRPCSTDEVESAVYGPTRKTNVTPLHSPVSSAKRLGSPVAGLRALTRPSETRANISKFTCGFSDYPIPDSKYFGQVSSQIYLLAIKAIG